MTSVDCRCRGSNSVFAAHIAIALYDNGCLVWRKMAVHSSSCPRLDNGRAINFFSGSDTYLRLVKTFCEWAKSMRHRIQIT